MKEAILEGYLGINNGDGGPFGAVIVYQGGIIGRGHNRVIRTNMPTRHAEIEAIEDACRKAGSYHIPDAVLFTTAEPCAMCYSAVSWSKIQTVYYGLTNDEISSLGFDELGFFYKNPEALSRINLHGGILQKECLELVENWKRQNGSLY